MKGQIPLTAILLLTVSLVTINAEPASQSLKGKSDEELLRIVVKGRNDTQKQQASDSSFSIDSSLLDGLWEMTPREAALALANEYVWKEAKGRVKFEIEKAPNKKPPTAGEIGIRWISGNYYSMPERGATVLHYDGSHSRLSISDFQILGLVSNQELENALNRTNEYDLPVALA